MTIYNQGGANPAALGVPGLYINVQAPPAAPLRGAPSDILAIVGTANWGPKNSPVPFSDEAGGAAAFGPMQARKFDMMTQVHAAAMQGAKNFRGVRVTDGTDVAATVAIQTTGGNATARYTGSGGNLIQIKIDVGSAPATWKVTVTKPGLAPEVFDNIPGTLNAAWVNIAAAINTGQAGSRGPSQLITFTAGASTTSPTTGGSAVNLASGTDGATTITGTVLIGVDTVPRTGMYALRNTGAAVFVLADNDDISTDAAAVAFGLSEQSYGFGVSASGDTLSAFGTAMNGAGLDTPWFKKIFGDWVYMSDPVAGKVRLVSPQGFLAGMKVALGPHQSLLNKPLYGIVGTQKSYAAQQYSTAELQLITQARGDVIVMQSPGGDYPSAAFGRNASSDVARHNDSYTGMTNYIARSLNAAAGLGAFVGRLITPDEMREAESAIGSFLQNEWDADRIGNAQGTIPYSVTIDASNNPPSSVALGIQKATVLVQYLSVLEFFLIDFSGGQTVEIPSAQPSNVTA